MLKRIRHQFFSRLWKLAAQCIGSGKKVISPLAVNEVFNAETASFVIVGPLSLTIGT
ncbi:protein of unknown function [Pararobbsia alpina]